MTPGGTRAEAAGAMRPRPVVGLGLCVLDLVLRVERFDWRTPRLRYDRCVEAGGGMVATAVVQAARLGCPAELLSLVGDDPDGRRLRRELGEAGVRTRRLVLSRRLPTTRCVVLVRRRDGERRFVVPERRALEAAAPRFDLSAVRRGALLLVDGHFPEQALAAARRARAVGAAVIGDFHRLGPAARRLLPWVDHPIVAEEFARELAGGARAAIEMLRRRWGGVPVVTQGERGGLYWHEGRIRRFQPTPIRVVDTTGAGDAFHGAFAAGLAHGLGLPAAIALAARAAAQCCRALGGRAALVGPEALRPFLGRRGPMV